MSAGEVMSDTDLADLPVHIAVAGAWRDQLVAWCESDLRWQIVDPGGALQPAAVLTDDPTLADGAVVVISDEQMAATGVDMRSHSRARGAVAVIAWPSQRHELVDAIARVVARAGLPQTPRISARSLRVAGIAPGVGTSTVALALGAWAAWSGIPTVVAGDADMLRLCGFGPWQGPGARELSLLPQQDLLREVNSLAQRVPAVPKLRVIGGGGRHLGGVTLGSLCVLIVDDRTDHLTADVLVAQRPEPQGVRMVGRCDPGAAVMPEGLPRPPSARPIADDVRVRVAGRTGRVPSGLPGRWLRDLARAAAVPPPAAVSRQVASQ